MKAIGIVMLVLIGYAAGAAQPAPTKTRFGVKEIGSSRKAEEVEIMHCLKAGDLDWLGNSEILDRAMSFQVGVRHDKKSHKRQEHIVVVVFENRRRGDVFDVTRQSHREHRAYRIENNGEFKIEQKEMEWPGEILGGIWTHEHMERNIRAIVRSPKVQISLKAFLKPFPAVSCSSYVSKSQGRDK